jgi:hypothetical protein
LSIIGTGTANHWEKYIESIPDRGFTLHLVKGVGANSDYHPFYKHKIPVLFFHSGTHKDYHRPGDDAHKINFKAEAEILLFLRDLLIEMDSHEPVKFRQPFFLANIRALFG